MRTKREALLRELAHDVVFWSSGLQAALANLIKVCTATPWGLSLMGQAMDSACTLQGVVATGLATATAMAGTATAASTADTAGQYMPASRADTAAMDTTTADTAGQYMPASTAWQAQHRRRGPSPCRGPSPRRKPPPPFPGPYDPFPFPPPPKRRFPLSVPLQPLLSPGPQAPLTMLGRVPRPSSIRRHWRHWAPSPTCLRAGIGGMPTGPVGSTGSQAPPPTAASPRGPLTSAASSASTDMPSFG